MNMEYTKKYEIDKDIDERITYLHEVKEAVAKEYAKMPEGALLVSPGTTTTSFRYYLRESPREKCGTYLDKTRNKDKVLYANKKYFKELLKNIDDELCKLDKIKSMQISDSIVNTFEKLNPGVKKLITPINVDDATYASLWMQMHYEGLKFDSKDNTSFYSDKGERMRSKSEVLIANALNKYKIPYKYERPVVRKNGELLYPDFTILDTKRRKEVYWEHLGKLDDMSYLTRNLWKLDEYKKINIHLGVNLFLTYETSVNPLGTKEIKRVIESVLI